MVALLMKEIFNFTTIEKKIVLEVCYKKFHKKKKMVGRVTWSIFEKTAKKLKLK